MTVCSFRAELLLHAIEDRVAAGGDPGATAKHGDERSMLAVLAALKIGHTRRQPHECGAEIPALILRDVDDANSGHVLHTTHDHLPQKSDCGMKPASGLNDSNVPDNESMQFRSPRWHYPLIGLILGIGAPLGAFLLRYATHPEVRFSPAAEIATHRFFYAYELIGTCLAFSVAGFAAGLHAERLRRAEAFYQNLSEHDPLTGLYNDRAFRDRYDRALERAVRLRQPISLLLIDVDHLKQINDRFGHLMGNEALLHVARALRRAKRSEDAAARWGGDEFAVLLESGDESAARRVADNVLQRLRRAPLVAPRGVIRVSVTIGMCSALGITAANDLFAAADRALYHGKHSGRDQVTLIRLGPQGGADDREATDAPA